MNVIGHLTVDVSIICLFQASGIERLNQSCLTQVSGRTPFSRDWYTLSSTNASVDDLAATGLDGSFVPGIDGSDKYNLQAVDYGIGQPLFLLPLDAPSFRLASMD